MLLGPALFTLHLLKYKVVLYHALACKFARKLLSKLYQIFGKIPLALLVASTLDTS